ncbi:hypothetical protein [Agaribacterium haliotis]|uniref:hypothetical protein n=1 Tax=Agaribacterium haliotis TaxID=2013869 RepID=UPI000BB5623E|nr:hypothetical protein [Agaribacterium haliotis]
MSLINDALNDLELRSAKTANYVEAKSSFWAGPVAKITSLFLLAFACFGAGYYFAGTGLASSENKAQIQELSTSSLEHAPSHSSSNSIASPAQHAAPEIKNVETVPLTIGQPGKVKSETMPVSPVEIQQANSNKAEQQRIAALLQQAELAQKQYRLSSPEKNNAVYFYNSVLQLRPENTQALAGLDQVKERYVQLYRRSLERNEQQKATTYAARLSKLLAADEVALFGQRMQKLQQQYSVDRALEGSEGGAQSVGGNSVASAPALSETPALKHYGGAEPTSDKRLSINKSQQQKRSETLAQLKRLMRQQDYVAARALVDKNAAAMQDVEPFIETQLELYLQQQDWPAMTRVLAEQEKRERVFVYYQARLTQHYQGENAAQQYLAGQSTALASTMPAQARAMYAGLLQKNKQHEQALQQYRVLVDQQQQNALYWLGLAVSADKLKFRSEAMSAYSVSARLGGHSVTVQEFIQKRYQQLQQEQQNREPS